MSTIVRATCNERGQSLKPRVLSASEQRAQPPKENKRDVWATQIVLSNTTLGAIMDTEKYSLLANRLINLNRVPPDLTVMAGHKAGTVAIRVGTKEYRSWGYLIYERKL